jgi:hypothetical protein
MADMEVSVWFGRETGLYFGIVLSVPNIFFDNLFNEIHLFLILIEKQVAKIQKNAAYAASVQHEPQNLLPKESF